jgi:hypothetical protein
MKQRRVEDKRVGFDDLPDAVFENDILSFLDVPSATRFLSLNHRSRTWRRARGLAHANLSKLAWSEALRRVHQNPWLQHLKHVELRVAWDTDWDKMMKAMPHVRAIRCTEEEHGTWIPLLRRSTPLESISLIFQDADRERLEYQQACASALSVCHQLRTLHLWNVQRWRNETTVLQLIRALPPSLTDFGLAPVEMSSPQTMIDLVEALPRLVRLHLHLGDSPVNVVEPLVATKTRGWQVLAMEFDSVTTDSDCEAVMKSLCAARPRQKLELRIRQGGQVKWTATHVEEWAKALDHSELQSLTLPVGGPLKKESCIKALVRWFPQLVQCSGVDFDRLPTSLLAYACQWNWRMALNYLRQALMGLAKPPSPQIEDSVRTELLAAATRLQLSRLEVTGKNRWLKLWTCADWNQLLVGGGDRWTHIHVEGPVITLPTLEHLSRLPRLQVLILHAPNVCTAVLDQLLLRSSSPRLECLKLLDGQGYVDIEASDWFRWIEQSKVRRFHLQTPLRTLSLRDRCELMARASRRQPSRPLHWSLRVMVDWQMLLDVTLCSTPRKE